jgi:hypothetical protein
MQGPLDGGDLGDMPEGAGDGIGLGAGKLRPGSKRLITASG